MFVTVIGNSYDLADKFRIATGSTLMDQSFHAKIDPKHENYIKACYCLLELL